MSTADVTLIEIQFTRLQSGKIALKNVIVECWGHVESMTPDHTAALQTPCVMH